MTHTFSPLRTATPTCVRQNERAGEYNEVASQLPVQSLGWLIAIIVSLYWAIPIAWATLAIYYSNLPWAGMRLALAAAFAAFTIWPSGFRVGGVSPRWRS
jgi:hypothetical protein